MAVAPRHLTKTELALQSLRERIFDYRARHGIVVAEMSADATAEVYRLPSWSRWRLQGGTKKDVLERGRVAPRDR